MDFLDLYTYDHPPSKILTFLPILLVRIDFLVQIGIMSRDICPCNICPSDICPSDNCSSDTCPGSHISGVIDQFLTTLVVEDCPNLVRIWPIDTCPGNNCPCNICSCNICPGDMCPGNICPSSHCSGTADQILVKL